MPVWMWSWQDRKVRIWDLRVNKSEGVMDAPSQSCVAFDQQVQMLQSTRHCTKTLCPHVSLQSSLAEHLPGMVGKLDKQGDVRSADWAGGEDVTVVWVQGLVLCVGGDRGLMRLYDPKGYEHGPFSTFTVRPVPSYFLLYSAGVAISKCNHLE